MNGKRKLKVRRSVYILMSLCLTAVLLGGCGKKQIQKTDNEEEVVEIPMILTVSPTSGKKSEQELVDAFNITYKGKYHIAVEWIMETESDYRQNLKRLNVTDKLPAVITGSAYAAFLLPPAGRRSQDCGSGTLYRGRSGMETDDRAGCA